MKVPVESLFEISKEVEEAIGRHQPVVALESTIITHGMPWPQNVETAIAVEQIIRDEGAIPATIAVMDGKIRVGLDTATLETLAKSENVMKLSRADLAYAVAFGKTGSTTVAATMMAAHRAGIDVFATGGIGGVHMDGENTMDISADLGELANTSMIVVCAGPKAILDIEKTLEVLETHGVAVASYATDELPAFWSHQSGIASPLRLDTPDEIAQLWKVRTTLKQNGALLINNPVPREAEIPASQMKSYIDQGIEQSIANRVSGKNLTPWLLDYIFQITGGKSLDTNIALIKNNAALAARIAVSLSHNSSAIKRPIGFV